MINGPGYLGSVPQAGMGISARNYQQEQAMLTQQYDPVRAEKEEREAHRRMMINNLTDTARSLEYVRQALTDLDMQAEAKAIDGVIVAMINKWNEERNAKCQQQAAPGNGRSGLRQEHTWDTKESR